MTPKILLFDIETFPTVIESWTVYEANYLRILRPTTVAAFCAKWYGQSKYITRGLCDYPGYKPIKLPRIGPIDDSKIVKEIWQLLDEADIVIAHNGDKFDIKKINARFWTHKMPPPSPYKTVDTLKQSRRLFGFDSHKLNEVRKQRSGEQKERTGGYDRWVGCMEGNMIDWRGMKKYVKKDVILLENQYKDELPWITNHPNLNLLSGTLKNCPNCGSANLQKRGANITRVSKHQRFQCRDCGAWSQGEGIKLTGVVVR